MDDAPRRSLLDLVAGTPPERDRYVDFLRGFSILVVVLGHWLIAVVTWRDGMISGENALEVIPGVWIATWILQVMPLFFFVGGFGNKAAIESGRRRGDSYAVYLARRVVRMLRPTIVFLGVGLVVVATLDALNVADNAVFPASTLITRPLWFLGVYLIVVALAPAMLRLHERHGYAVLGSLLFVAVAVDLVRFSAGVSWVGFVNYPVVWLLAHQAGFFYGERTVLDRWRNGLAIVGLAGQVAATTLGPYPGSMVGLSTDEFSNMDPPTLAIVALATWQIGLAMLLRPVITRMLQRVRVWAGVILVNSVIMTVFLWHLTAMLFGIGILYPLGFPQPDPGTLRWWLLRPIWIGSLAAILAGLVAVFGRVEQRTRFRDSGAGPVSGSTLVAATGAVLAVLGVLGFALGGMHQLFSVTGVEVVVFRVNPVLDVVHIALGAGLVLGATRRRSTVGASALAGSVVLVALVGFGVIAGFDANRLAVNRADAFLYAALGAVLIASAVIAARRTAPEDRGTPAVAG